MLRYWPFNDAQVHHSTSICLHSRPLGTAACRTPAPPTPRVVFAFYTHPALPPTPFFPHTIVHHHREAHRGHSPHHLAPPSPPYQPLLLLSAFHAYFPPTPWYPFSFYRLPPPCCLITSFGPPPHLCAMISSPWRALAELFSREKASLEANHHFYVAIHAGCTQRDGLIGIAEVVPRPARMLVRHLPWIFSACCPCFSRRCGLFAFLPRTCFFFSSCSAAIPHGYRSQAQANGPVMIPTGSWKSLFAFFSILSDAHLK